MASCCSHCFIIVTDDDDGSERARISYGPENNSKKDPGALVDVTDDPDSKTNKSDIDIPKNGTDLTAEIDLNALGFTDDEIIAAGETVNELLGNTENPGSTEYKFNPNGTDGYANSNSGIARVLEEAKSGSSKEIPWPRYALGWRHSSIVGTAPIVLKNSPPDFPDGFCKSCR